MKLYTYYRSSAAFRVRIALNMKGIAYESVAKHLRREGGQHRKAEYRALNPQALIPTLDDDGMILTQSLAIIEYLDEIHPLPPLLPRDPVARARVRMMSHAIASDIHPLNNLRVLKYLKDQFGVDQTGSDDWYRHWVDEAFVALEQWVLTYSHDGHYCFGDGVTVADLCLVPQVYNARRFKVPLDRFPGIVAVDAALMKLPAFDAARPENQPDAE
jgi:maleylacetoacetate isomerase